MKKFIPRNEEHKEFLICMIVIPVLIFLTALAATL